MKVKCGRDEYEVTNKDLILDNGACYQLITKKKFLGWNEYSPTISKTLFNKMLKAGLIRKSKKIYKGFYNTEYPLYEFVTEKGGTQ